MPHKVKRLIHSKARRIREKHRGICLEVVRDLADIAVKIAEYDQTEEYNYISHLRSEWKALFLRNQSIYEFVEHTDDEDVDNEEGEKVAVANKVKTEDGEELSDEARAGDGGKKQFGKESKIEDKRRLIQLEVERRAALADADFENYRDLAPPWDEFVPEGKEGAEEEVSRLGGIVLGYVVHRLLQILYPYPTETAACPVPRVKVAAVISGVTNSISHERLQESLKSSGIRLLRMEDAINHCLERYKREMAGVEYIDLNIVSPTARDTKRLETKSKTDDSRDRQPKRIERTSDTAAAAAAVGEKQTQTPRQIPHDDMDPILSDAAYIGRKKIAALPDNQCFHR